LIGSVHAIKGHPEALATSSCVEPPGHKKKPMHDFYGGNRMIQHMDPQSHQSLNQELELKLYLASTNTSALGKQLARASGLSRRKATHQVLHNIYYDTPDQQLRKLRVVLRLRRIGDSAKPQWLQTLKLDAGDASALSCRGEWESPVAGAHLSVAALKGTPWKDFDIEGSLFLALVPCFETVFERMTWLVRKRDGSVIEVAFDLGYIEAGGKRTPICELELELKVGHCAALFDLAQEIARSIAVLPANMSKAQRGFLLMQDGLNLPQVAQSHHQIGELSIPLVAQRFFRDMFVQFTNNLDSFRVSDDPEVVHQARVGWRRFKSGIHLFKKIVPIPPSLDGLHTLVTSLGELRNLEVALTETLPALTNAYVMGDEQRAQSWQALLETLKRATEQRRDSVRNALQLPTVGASLLAIAQWLENLSEFEELPTVHRGTARHWAERQILRLNKQMEKARTEAETLDQWHQVRILAKRLRYSSEAMRELLPRKLAKDYTSNAAAIQSRIGAKRDLAQASALVTKLNLDRCIAEFLRGVVIGAERP
jgi:inorganic triphosphatase YgiF